VPLEAPAAAFVVDAQWSLTTIGTRIIAGCSGRGVRQLFANEECAWVQVAITCRHGSIPDDVRETISRKSEKLLTYFERVTAIGVTVIFEPERIKGRIRVEILLDAEHKHNFVAIDEGDDVPSTFERALGKMEQQLKKYKAKIQDHRRGARMNEVAEEEKPQAESG
jgi:putative sigma-54 modulation protein